MAKPRVDFPTDATRTVCLDVDGVLCAAAADAEPTTFGEIYEGAVEFTHALAERFEVIIHSSRISEGTWPGVPVKTLRRVLKWWLDGNGFAYDSIWTGRGKPSAIMYIDDRAVSCRPEEIGQRAFDLVWKALEILAV